METLLIAGKIVYGGQFNPLITLKVLGYFKGGDLEALPEEVQKRLVRALKVIKEAEIEKHFLKFQKGQNKNEE